MYVKDSEFTFPSGLLSQINECSNGGYILFTVNSNNIPEVHTDCDNVVNALALQQYMANWLQALEESNVAGIIESFNGSGEDDGGVDGGEELLD